MPYLVPRVPIQVGIFIYLWYNPEEAESWEHPKIQDTPLNGNYDSSNIATIKTQLTEICDLKIDFLILSWWGNYNESVSHSFINNVTSLIFETIKQNSINLKVAVMVEPFNESGSYNFTEIYDHIQSNYVSQYPEIYFEVNGKPLVCFFNGPNLTAPSNFQFNSDFTVKIVGNDNTAEWIYDSVTQKNNPVANPPPPRDRQMSMSPRYDDFYVRPNNETVDQNLEYLYQQQLDYILRLISENRIDYVTITSWNEYPERTAIEPHYDVTANNKDPYFLYNTTKEYIQQIKSD